MITNELSLIRFNVLNFFHLVLTSHPFQPVSTKLIKVVTALISSEPEKDEKLIERIKWIHTNTHEKVMLPLSVIEYAVFKNLEKNLNREIDIKNKSFNLVFLYRILDEISLELTNMVIEIAKKFSIDIPILNYGTQKATTNIEV